MNNDFSFKNINEINSCVAVLDLLLNLPDFNTLYNDRKLVEKAKDLLKNIAGTFDASISWFDEKSVNTRSAWKDYVKSFAETPSEDIQKLLQYNFDSLALFLSLLSTEIIWNDFRDLEGHKGSVVRPEPHVMVLEEMADFVDYFISKSKQRRYVKDRVKYYENYLSSIDFDTATNTIQEKVDKATKLVEETEESLVKAREIIPQALENNLRQTADELSKDFKSLLENKQSERKKISCQLKCLGCGLIAFPIVLPLLIYQVTGAYEILSNSTVPLITIEVFLFYFFKIILNNYHRTNAHITQLETRTTLARFIPSYVTFEQNKENSVGLDKFSTHIFSPLLGHEKDIIKITSKLSTVIGEFLIKLKKLLDGSSER